MARSDLLRRPSKALTIAAACIVIGALYFARDVMVPVAVALLLTFLLAPLAHRVERMHIPRVPAVLIVVIISFAIIACIGWLITSQVRDLATKLNDYRYDIELKVEHIKQWVGHGPLATLSQMARDVAASQPGSGTSTAPRGTPQNPFAVQVTSTPETPQSAFQAVGDALSLVTPLAQCLIIVVFVIFMLIQREDLRDRLIRLVGHGQLTVTTQAMDDAATRVSRYLIAQSAINGAYGLVIGFGLYFLRIPNAPLWGLLCAVLRFIPYLGVWMAAAFPIILSFVVPDGYYAARPLLTILMFVVVELSVANAVEPLLFGTRTGVSPLAILFAAVFWTWLWGGVGLLLSTPMTVILAVVGKYVPQMQFLDVLLGDQPVLEPFERYYQRLLADDPEDAEDLLDEFVKTHTAEQLYSRVILPALSLCERDHQREVLDEPRRDIIRQAIRDQVESHRPAPSNGAPAEPDQQSVPRDSHVNVLCVPANDEADEIVGVMFADLLEAQGYDAHAVSADALASERVEWIAKVRADLVVISALPPGAVAHARYLCKRITARYPKIHIVAGLWNMNLDVAKAKSRISNSADFNLTTRMEEGLAMVHQMVQAVLIRPGDNPAFRPEDESRPQPAAPRPT